MLEQDFFIKIMSTRLHHACFLNTLSFMELRGAQKLSRLVSILGHHSFFLEHVAEEYRHAYFLRNLAQKVLGHEINDFSSTYLLGAKESRNYISYLDRRICLLLRERALRDHAPLVKWRAYLLSTFAIETRALIFYRQYQEALDREKMPISVKSILKEEERHLAEIVSYIDQDQALADLTESALSLEKTLFEQWLRGLNCVAG